MSLPAFASALAAGAGQAIKRGEEKMISLTQLNGTTFSLNEQLIEIIENIPETKISLTNGRYYLVQESREDIAKQIIDYQRRIFKNIIQPHTETKQTTK